MPSPDKTPEARRPVKAQGAFPGGTVSVYQERRLRWMPLDNAAKIYPAAQRQNWSNVYRLSVTLTEPVDRETLRTALETTVPRFPSIAARLRRGMFWYYLQQLPQAPEILEESSFPLTPMSRKEMCRCALRVIIFGRRIAVEFFHSLTDGTGALIFLKTLLAEYLQQRHGIQIPAEDGILSRSEEPKPEELEDSFLKYAGPVSQGRGGSDAWHPRGEEEVGGVLHVTCLRLSVKAVLERAHSYGVTLNTYLGAVMLIALQNLQAQKVADIRRRKPLTVLLPVNLRRLFPSSTLRNFALYTIPEIDPRLGEYTLGEACRIVHHKIGLEANAKHMSTVIAANVGNERMLALKLVPLVLKDVVMRAVFNAVGEKKSSLCMSNLGAVRLPEVMKPWVERFDFILGVQATSPYNCGVISYGDTMNINFIRNIRQPDLERCFFEVLRAEGLEVTAESNGCGKKEE